MSWQWRMMQNLKRNCLVSSKLTWGIWRILTRPLENLKNLHLNGLLLNKVHVWVKKSIGEFCLMALNINATFEGKLTCAFKNDIRNLANFHLNTWKCQNWYSHGILLLKVEKSGKSEEELTCRFRIDMRNLTNFDPSTRKSQKFAL